MNQICELKNCTGCFACMNICPKGAISNNDGYPLINNDLCVDCEGCKKICPVLNPIKMNNPLKVYAVWSKKEKDQKNSSSGGAAAVFTEYMLSKNNVVYGSASMNGTVKHICVDNRETAELLRGSKYVQSDIGTIYKDVKNKLNNGKEVLFIGTPCQVAGLKNFLKKDYSTLFTIDLICHGTPPIKYLKEHLASQTKKEWTSVMFRGQFDYFLTAFMNDKIVYQKQRFHDLYFMAFLEALTFRKNCYQCIYAKPTRVSDITIGDFWGLNRNLLKNSYNGRISLLITNTKKGEAFFERNKVDFVWEERTIEEAVNPSQGNLIHPSIPHPDRDKFEQYYQKYGFEKAVNKTQIGKNVKIKIIKDAIKQSFAYKVLKKIGCIFINRR